MSKFPVTPSQCEELSGDYDAETKLSSDEIEVRLAIADFIIRRVNGTPAGREIFKALIPRFENKYPHHKILAGCLTAPEYIESDDPDFV